MSLLALLDEGPAYGLALKNEFEARTAGVWPLNVGQVYTTLARLERDGLIREKSEKSYAITAAGRTELRGWFEAPAGDPAATRDELVLKIVMAAGRGIEEARAVIQSERKMAIRHLQDYTRLKRDGGDGDLGWAFLLDSLIFRTEARVRWLDACEERLQYAPARAQPRAAKRGAVQRKEARR
jgi:DNA-binding PadR family transcriptional regulator